MGRYVLDTNTCIYLINGNATLMKKVREIGVYSIGISNATLAELYFGAYNSQYVEANLLRIAKFKKNLSVYSDSHESACRFGQIKAHLKSRGLLIEDFDILIASIALVNDCILVTNNLSHFQRINDLRLENWLT
jgi:tRNA(fMet)-specific endonuclease VapC